jgi:hypothetical protein
MSHPSKPPGSKQLSKRLKSKRKNTGSFIKTWADHIFSSCQTQSNHLLGQPVKATYLALGCLSQNPWLGLRKLAAQGAPGLSLWLGSALESDPWRAAGVLLLMRKNRWGGFGDGIPGQAPKETAPPGCLKWLEIVQSRQDLGKRAPGLSGLPWEKAPPGLVTWEAFTSFLLEPNAWVPPRAALNPLEQDCEPPYNTPRCLSGACGNTRQRDRSWHRRAHGPAGFPQGTAHPAPVSPPLPWGGLHLTGRLAGDSHTWFARMELRAKGMGDAQVSACPLWLPRQPLDPCPSRRALKTNPDVKTSQTPDTQRLLERTPSSTQSTTPEKTRPLPLHSKPWNYWPCPPTR